MEQQTRQQQTSEYLRSKWATNGTINKWISEQQTSCQHQPMRKWMKTKWGKNQEVLIFYNNQEFKKEEWQAKNSKLSEPQPRE